MAKSALNELQQQIAAVRNEAFTAGYAAAMTSIREFANRPASTTKINGVSRRSRRDKPVQTTPSRPRQRVTAKATRKPYRRGSEHGANARLVEEVLQVSAPRALRPFEIRTALQHDKGVAISFTSVANALRQLRGRNSVEQNDDGKSWRYRVSGAAA